LPGAAGGWQRDWVDPLLRSASSASLAATDSTVRFRGGSGHAAAFRRLETPPFGRAMREKSILRRFSAEDAVA
jgi:hypothetical protein